MNSSQSDQAPAERKRVVFVDDEPNVLDSLRDAMRPQRHRWEMRFFGSGQEALDSLAADSCDVIVSDLLMPGMDGATLLGNVRELVPSAARVVLSGHAELRVIAKAAGVAHQLLAKPCETANLIRVIERCYEINDAIARVELSRSALGATTLPAAPEVHMQLSDALRSERAGLREIASIVEQDVGTSAKVMQLANSAYFGFGRAVTGVADAVGLLGLETLQALVLQAGAFNSFTIDPPIPNFDLERLHRHCYRVGHLARALLAAEPGKDAFTAGLLHDVGLLVLATQERELLTEIIALAREQQRPIFDVERECCEITHAEIGAHLLALWGVPFPVTGAVLTHHEPPTGTGIHDEATATYVANILVEEIESGEGSAALPPSKLDPAHLDASGLAEKLPVWRELAAAELERLG